MFRVDPAFKSAPLLSKIRGTDTEDYNFLQLTHYRPIWILHALSSDGELESSSWSRYMFEGLEQAVEIASDPAWAGKILYVLLPDYMTANQRVIASIVTQIWECRKRKGGVRCFEVTTEAGVHLISQDGSHVKRAKRVGPIWMP